MDILDPTPAPAEPQATPPQAAPAPVATPVPPAQPAIPEPAPVVEYAKTGDPALDVALDFFAKSGIDPEDPAMAAAAQGDFLLLKAKLAQLGDKARGADSFVALAEAAYQRRTAQEAAHAQAVLSAAATAVGGQETWDSLKTWAATTLSEAERAGINAAFKGASPEVAAILGQGLLARYREAGGTVTGRPVTQPGARTVTAPQGALSAEDYAAAVRALSAKTRGNPEASPEYQALRTRRSLGIQQGI